MQRRKLYWRRLRDRIARGASGLAVAMALAGMCWILWTLFEKGWGSLSWSFLTQPSKPYGVENSGIANALVGTLLITAFAALLTLPPAIAGGIYLAEYGQKSRLGHLIRFSANVMMGIPSIVVGLFVYAIYVVPTGHFSGFAGSLALGFIMFPVILRTTEEMLLLVPTTQREAALALGMTRARTTLSIVFRSAKGGLATGILMALARVSGETAPLLLTALWSNAWCENFFSAPTPNVPVLMTEYTTNSPFEALHTAGWGAALVMMVGILAMNVVVRWVNRGQGG